MLPLRRLPLLALAPLLACSADSPLQEPELVESPSPFVYPLSLWDANLEGETMLRVKVSSAGDVDSAYVDVSSGYEEFDSAAIAGVHDLRFRPARQGDEEVDAWIKLPVRFIKDTAVASFYAAPTNAGRGTSAGAGGADGAGEAPAGTTSADGAGEAPAGTTSADGAGEAPAGTTSADGAGEAPAGTTGADGAGEAPAGTTGADGMDAAAAGDFGLAPDTSR